MEQRYAMSFENFTFSDTESESESTVSTIYFY